MSQLIDSTLPKADRGVFDGVDGVSQGLIKANNAGQRNCLSARLALMLAIPRHIQEQERVPPKSLVDNAHAL